MLVAAAIAVAFVWPGAELVARAGEGAQVQAWMGWAAMAVGAGASAMLALAMLGASYESLMPGGTQ
jgi:hypothetical protein